MIRNSLRQFQESIDTLREYLRVSAEQEQAMIDLSDNLELLQSQSLLNTLTNNYKKLSFSRKVIDYSAIFILVYGALERYIEDVAQEYLKYLCSLVDSYQDLPQKIKDNHLQKSLELINNLKLDKFKGIEPEPIIEHLYSCQSLSSSYQLNFAAYTHHTANFRHGTINSFFQELGIQNINHEIINKEKFKQHIIQNESEVALFNLSRGEHETILAKIDEVVQARNKISHGQSIDYYQSLQLSIYIDYIDFIEQYIKALQEVLLDQLLPFEVSKKGVRLDQLITVINNSIICVKVSNLTLKIGDRIASYNDNSKSYAQGQIISMQVNNQDREQISVTEKPIDIGIKVNFRVKNNQEFYLIRNN